jgi:hypothetical protein
VTTPILSANKKLRGFEHAYFGRRRKRKGRFEHFLGHTHLRHGEKKSREKEKLKDLFIVHVHADQVPIFENLKETMHDIIVAIIVYDYFFCLSIISTDIF